MGNIRYLINEHSYFCYFIITLMILLGTKVSIISIITLAILCVVIIETDFTSRVCFLCYFLPFSTIFKLNPSSTSLYTLVLLLTVLLEFVRKPIVTKTGMIVVCFMLYNIFVQLFNDNFSATLTAKMFAGLLLVSYCSDKGIDKEYKKVFSSFILGIIISATVAMFLKNIFPIENYVVQKELGYNMGVFRFAGLSSDPNYFGVNTISGLVASIILFVYGKISVKEFAFYGGSLLFFTVYTLSKSNIIMIVLCSLIFLYAALKKRSTWMIALSFIVIICGVLFVLFSNNEIISTILSRFSGNEGTATVLTNRDLIWAKYKIAILKTPFTLLFGYGLGAPLYLTSAAHNTLIEIVYHSGAVGAFLFLIFIVNINNSKRNSDYYSHRKSMLNLSLIIIVFVMYMFLSEYQLYEMPFHIIMASIVYKLPCKIPTNHYDE